MINTITYPRQINGKRVRLYQCWLDMKARSNNHRGNYPTYKNVDLYDEWKSYEPFAKWALSNGYNDNLTLDRIDSKGNYEPSNCQWITMSENSKKSNKHTGCHHSEESKHLISLGLKRFHNLSKYSANSVSD